MEEFKMVFGTIIKGVIGTYLNHPELIFSIIAIIIIDTLLIIYYPKIKGIMGEYKVKQELNKLPKNRYLVLNNIMFKDNRGTHQIDHIVLSKYGIFVIEMKNYYGVIKGKEYNSNWCQDTGRKKRYFMNPIHQNYGHIKSLADLLNLDEKYFISIICFSNQAKIPICDKTIVTQLNYLINEILMVDTVILEKDINAIANKILANNIKEKTEQNYHVKNIKNRIKANEELIHNMICPRCGGKLIKKTGKYGDFIGCSNFPKCRYINNEKTLDNMICPKCGGKLTQKTGKYGDFIGCSNFPKCRYIKK